MSWTFPWILSTARAKTWLKKILNLIEFGFVSNIKAVVLNWQWERTNFPLHSFHLKYQKCVFIYRHTNTLFIVIIFNVLPGKEYEHLIYVNKKYCKLALRVKRTLRPCSPKIYISRFNLLLKFLQFSFKFHWFTIKISVDYFQIDSLCMINSLSFIITSTKIVLYSLD